MDVDDATTDDGGIVWQLTLFGIVMAYLAGVATMVLVAKTFCF